MHYLEITLFVKPRKPVGHFLNTEEATLLVPSEGSACVDDVHDANDPVLTTISKMTLQC